MQSLKHQEKKQNLEPIPTRSDHPPTSSSSTALIIQPQTSRQHSIGAPALPKSLVDSTCQLIALFFPLSKEIHSAQARIQIVRWIVTILTIIGSHGNNARPPRIDVRSPQQGRSETWREKIENNPPTTREME